MLRRLGVLAAGLVLAGCSSSSGGGFGVATLGGPDVDDLKVSGSEQVAVPASARLSPDGTRVLLMVARPCVRKVDGSDERCVDREKVNPDLANAAWSPDGTKLAFTDDFWRLAYEPDVWVFDALSGDLRNLTDDGEDDYDVSGGNDNAWLDVLPSWSADGETIRFARGRAKQETVELVSVPAEGGEVSTLREIRCSATTLSALAWSTSRVAWTCGTNAGEVFLAGHSDGEAAEALPAEDGEDRMLLSFSADGMWLLVDSLGPYGLATSPEGGLARAVPAAGGDPVPVAEGAVGFPTWSPSGHALAYVDLAATADRPARLMVVGVPGGEPKELRRAERGFSALDGRRLSWAPDRLLVRADREPVLLTLTD